MGPHLESPQSNSQFHISNIHFNIILIPTSTSVLTSEQIWMGWQK